MLLRFRPWAVDGLDSHTKQVGLTQLVFEDAQQGVLDVRRQSEIEALLRDPSQRYELAYDRYGVVFDAQGVEVTPIPCVPAGSVGGLTTPTFRDSANPPTRLADRAIKATSAFKRRGRPKKR